MHYRIEISVDSVESAIAAEQGGAHRVELCSALREGGLTPSLGLIRAVRSRVSAQVYVLIRPRSGDFLYSDVEFQLMQDDIAIAKQAGIDGVVLGVLTAEGEVDVPRTKALVEAADPLPVTFHRAFDMVRSPRQALQDVIDCGASRILTSGGRPTAVEGREQLKELVQAAAERIGILAGGGVRPTNVGELAEWTGVSEFHSSMRRIENSAMMFRAPEMHLGEEQLDEYTRTVVLADDVRQLVHAVQSVTVS